MGHLIGSFLVFVTLLLLTWGVEFLLAWLNNHQPLSDADLTVISKLKIALLSFDAVLCAYVSISGARFFLIGAKR